MSVAKVVRALYDHVSGCEDCERTLDTIADRLDRLAALESALRVIAGDLDDAAYPAIRVDRMRAIARRALAESESPPASQEVTK